MKILHIGCRALAILALALVVTPASTSFAQATGDDAAKKDSGKPKPAAADQPAGDTAPKADKPADASADKANKKAKSSDDADDEGDGANGKAKNPKTAKKKMVKEEAKYRDQMARIDRLREIAKENNDEKRLAELDKLEAKLTNLHERKMNKQRKRLSDEDAKAMDKHLEKGKSQGLEHGKGPDGQGPPGQLKKEEGATSNDNAAGNDKGEKAAKKDAGTVTEPKADGAPGEKAEKKDADAPDKSKGNDKDKDSDKDNGNKGGSKKP